MISEEFKQYVESGDVFSVKSILIDDMISDKSFSVFDRKLKFATDRMHNLLQAHDGRPFKSESEWNESYLNLLKVELLDNFSQERIAQLKRVIQTVLPDIVPVVAGRDRTGESSATYGDSTKKNNRAAKSNEPRPPFLIAAAIVIMLAAIMALLNRR